MSRLFGQYVVMACDRSASKNERLELMKAGFTCLMDELKEIDTTMEPDTLEIILHEGMQINDPSWHDDSARPFWGITVGAKYKGEYLGGHADDT